MEHRHSKRVTIPLKLKVTIDKNITLHTVADNINGNGLFMRLTHPALQVHTFIDIELCNEPQECWQTQAMVIHASSCGTGVLFADRLPAGFVANKPEAMRRVASAIPIDQKFQATARRTEDTGEDRLLNRSNHQWRRKVV